MEPAVVPDADARARVIGCLDIAGGDPPTFRALRLQTGLHAAQLARVVAELKLAGRVVVEAGLHTLVPEAGCLRDRR